ncbi:uncharacterized protein LOC124594778 [Schistocerca americana]|uniref:uncharacterized protein LOC124594778 n=1 Tax=Schistocerca americana TaxID=7009 RepID=UPI001F4F3984|nr:uncharacterized protein LOC124594778 [Schistocerca americana]XP_046989140.1 uncharacterized protein LOC124594778 [Schistocerca americana]
MGQRLSDLRGYFGVMEDEETGVATSGSFHVTGEDSVSGSPSGSNSNACSTVADNTTEALSCPENSAVQVVEHVDQHFESIYNIGIEGFRIDEASVNVVESDLCSYHTEYSCIAKGDCNCVDEGTSSAAEEQNLEILSGSYNGQTLTLVNGKRSRTKLGRSSKELGSCGKKKRNHWVLKFNCARLKGGGNCGPVSADTDIAEPNISCESCICTGYRRTEDHHLGAGVIFKAGAAETGLQESSKTNSSVNLPSSDNTLRAVVSAEHLIDMSRFNPEDYPIEDCDERARIERAREIAEGVEPPPGFLPSAHIQISLDEFTAFFQSHLNFHPSAFSACPQIDMNLSSGIPRTVHTQVDYIHCLVPDLLQITSCSFYWGKMDRYEAERLLEGKPEGTFLLRDSAQDEYLFSVSFRKYGRSLHARIEQWNHRFSFDSHDPGVFASPTVCGLIEHYKDPSCCMFFEPMLTIPLHRNFTFPLQHLCRAVVCSRATYDGLNQLNLPKSLKSYLKEYHYKQRVRVRRLDLEQ